MATLGSYRSAMLSGLIAVACGTSCYPAARVDERAVGSDAPRLAPHEAMAGWKPLEPRADGRCLVADIDRGSGFQPGFEITAQRALIALWDEDAPRGRFYVIDRPGHRYCAATDVADLASALADLPRGSHLEDPRVCAVGSSYRGMPDASRARLAAALDACAHVWDASGDFTFCTCEVQRIRFVDGWVWRGR